MIQIAYWSGTGNTESMAKHIAEGILAGGSEVHTSHVASADMDELLAANLIVLGCPSMGSEELEEDEMQPFVEALLPHMQGKHIALFGSYGWGSGEWMENWAEQMKSAGAAVVYEPLIINEFTKGQDEEVCIAYGKNLVSL